MNKKDRYTPKIILASSSPRRKALLKLLFEDFTIFSPVYHEHNVKGTAKDNAMLHANEKASAAAKEFEKGLIISADTLVECDKRILGKPKDKKDAEKMLAFISGKKVFVYTGISVIDAETKKRSTGFEKTELKIKKLIKDEIKDYIATGEPLDKAGAFAIQGKGGLIVEKINGDYYNVIGLPLLKLKKMLGKFNYL